MFTKILDLVESPQIMKNLFVFLLLISVWPIQAQVVDDFSDGDFTANPVWSADNAANWTIATNQLRSNSTISNSTFYISTPSTSATSSEWNFLINLQFNTSSENLVDIYLTSDQANLTSTSNNGYFVRIGGTPDEVSLFKRTAGAPSVLIDGINGITNVSDNILRVKVVRDAANLWTLSRDTSGGTNYFVEGTTTDNSFTTSSFFGININQSVTSFHNKHFFDDIYVGDIILDTSPPTINSITILSATELEVLFSEKVEKTSAETASNYTVNNSVGIPQSATLLSDEKTVRLIFTNNFPNATTSILSVTTVEDLLSNAVTTAISDFFFFEPVPASTKEIVFSEILADPTPSTGLPEAEFVEIFNRSTKAFDLAGWTFKDGSVEKLLPAKIVLPGEYVVLVNSSSADLFSSVNNVLSITSFPTLTNTGEPLVLKDNTGLVIDSLFYSDDWYNDEDKQQGGWTLELIDPENICGDAANWAASEQETGGTPGMQNSVNENKPDLTGPQLLSVFPIQATQLKLIFNEKLEKLIPAATSFTLNPVNQIISVSFTDITLRELLLNLSQPLFENTLYELMASNIRDCAGNTIQQEFNTIAFALPKQAEPGDILINEILFNPRPNAVDFVEVYNNSEKFINLKELFLSNLEDNAATNQQRITENDFLLYPNSFKVFTSNTLVVKNEYPQGKEQNFLETDLPSMNDDMGSVAIVDSSGIVLDHLIYSDDWHSPLLKDEEGVSLERISIEQPSSLPQNWRSGVKATGFATPGYANANSSNGIVVDEAVKIEPEIFEPVYGQPNYTQIHYKFDQPGFIVNAKIYDTQGREIKVIANNEVLAPQGFFTWDGDRNDGTKARIGYYTLWMEIFNTSGVVKIFRKRIVIAGKF